MVKLVVVLLNPLNQEYSLPMNYSSVHFFVSKDGFSELDNESKQLLV